MILTLYLTFVGLSILILGVGMYLGENYFSFIGLFFLFLLGNHLLFNGLDYETGVSVTTNYTYTNGTVSSNEAVLVYDYTNFKNDDFTRWFGFLIALASGFGLGALLFQANRDFKEKYDRVREFGE